MLIKDACPLVPELPKTTDPNGMEGLFKQEYRNSYRNQKILYIHTPYCNGKCKFCICPSISYQTKQELTTFIDQTLPAQINRYGDLLEELRFDEVYFGGGTPTLIDASSWEGIFQQIPHFAEIPIKCFEATPETMTFEHLELLKRHHFSYISLGVQTLDPDICRWQNRKHIHPEQLRYLSSVLREQHMYFNLDLICYLGAGDITDIPDFRKDMDFLMRECKASSICIHQLLQSHFTCEKTKMLVDLIKEMLDRYPEYECINSELLDEDITEETMYRVEYRLVREKREFRHYMWNKFPSIPIEGYDVLALGYTDRVSIKSNAGNLLYIPAKQHIERIAFNHRFAESEREIRKRKGLPV